MSFGVQVEGGSGYTSQAVGVARFPALVQPHPSPVPQQHHELAQARQDGRLEVPLCDLTFRHLKTAQDIAGVVHLRREIQVVAAGVADPAFVTREKKEMTRALSPLSNAVVTSSGRFASSP